MKSQPTPRLTEFSHFTEEELRPAFVIVKRGSRVNTYQQVKTVNPKRFQWQIIEDPCK